MPPLAYLVTWRTHGSWLPGTPGAIDRHHNGYGEPARPQSQMLADHSRLSLLHGPVLLDRGQRAVVVCSIERTAVAKQWTLIAVNARTNHVHVVVGASAEPEVVLRTLKAWATRDLREQYSQLHSQKIWASHGSTRYLWDEESLARAHHYVREMQDVPPEWKER